MRSRKVLLLCSAAFLTLAGLMVGQQQGPLKDPSVTVAKPRKTDDKKDADSYLPKIPSQYNKKDKIDIVVGHPALRTKTPAMRAAGFPYSFRCALQAAPEATFIRAVCDPERLTSPP